MKHTPGPWCIGDSNLPVSQFAVMQSEPTGKHSTILRMAIGEPKHGEVMANARLIAAAPDLLAACKRLLVEVEWEALRADIVTDEARADIALAKEAIAKATGETA